MEGKEGRHRAEGNMKNEEKKKRRRTNAGFPNANREIGEENVVRAVMSYWGRKGTENATKGGTHAKRIKTSDGKQMSERKRRGSRDTFAKRRSERRDKQSERVKGVKGAKRRERRASTQSIVDSDGP